MKKRLYNFFVGGKEFEKEFKRQLRMFINITFGFTIAFTWRQTIFDVSQSFISFLFHPKNSYLSSIITSIFITLISIFLIFLSSHFLKQAPKNNKHY